MNVLDVTLEPDTVTHTKLPPDSLPPPTSSPKLSRLANKLKLDSLRLDGVTEESMAGSGLPRLLIVNVQVRSVHTSSTHDQYTRVVHTISTHE
jgi:hypothetical protein